MPPKQKQYIALIDRAYAHNLQHLVVLEYITSYTVDIASRPVLNAFFNHSGLIGRIVLFIEK